MQRIRQISKYSSRPSQADSKPRKDKDKDKDKEKENSNKDSRGSTSVPTNRVLKFKHKRYSGRIRRRESLKDKSTKKGNDDESSQGASQDGPGSARSNSTGKRLLFRKANIEPSQSPVVAGHEDTEAVFSPLELREEEVGLEKGTVDSGKPKLGPGSKIQY